MLPSQLFTWRRQAREGRLTGGEDTVTFAQAMIAHSPPSVASSSSRMEIVLADGVRVIVGKDVDADALARVIGAILRR